MKNLILDKMRKGIFPKFLYLLILLVGAIFYFGFFSYTVGETARLWIFLLPLVAFFMAFAFHTSLKNNTVLLALTKDLNDRFPFAETFMISAERGHGVDALRSWLAGVLPEGPWLYPEDQIADLPMRMIAAEITREKLTLRLHQELPYQLTVETENWEERKDGSARIDQVIYVMRDGHKGIVLGKKGETIKAISKLAREELEEFLGRPVPGEAQEQNLHVGRAEPPDGILLAFPRQLFLQAIQAVLDLEVGIVHVRVPVEFQPDVAALAAAARPPARPRAAVSDRTDRHSRWRWSRCTRSRLVTRGLGDQRSRPASDCPHR